MVRHADPTIFIMSKEKFTFISKPYIYQMIFIINLFGKIASMRSQITILMIFICLVNMLAITHSKYFNLTKARRGVHPSKVQDDQTQCTYTGLNVNSTAMQLGNCQFLFNLQIGIGTPPQFFFFQFDTGSNVLWVPTKQTNPSGFNTTESSTYQVTSQQYEIEYADGSGVIGDIGSEVLTIAQTPIQEVRNPVLFVTRQQKMNFPGAVIGIVGMGYSDTPNFLDSAYEKGLIQTNTFSLNLSQSQEETSILYYDTLPDRILTQTLSSPVYGQGYWQLQVIGFYAGQTDLTSYTVGQAVIDSGTTYFYLNPSLYNYLKLEYLLNNNNCRNDGDLHICLCSYQDSIPSFKVIFSGLSVQIFAKNYFIPIPDEDGYCVVQLNSLGDESDILLLGDTLFYNYVVTFSKQESSVGFAQRFQDNKNGTDPNNPKPQFIYNIGLAQWFITAEWVMFGFDVVILIVFVFLLYHLRLLNDRDIRTKLIQQSRNGPYQMTTVNNQRYPATLN